MLPAQLLNFFAELGTEPLNRIIEEIINKHKGYIINSIRKKVFDRSAHEDAQQFVLLEIFKSYKNYYKYPNFDSVVKSLVPRRLMDFTKHFTRRDSPLIHYQQQDDESSIQLEVLTGEFHEDVHKEDVGKVLEVIGNNLSVFNEWELEYMNLLREFYEENIEYEYKDLIECMGHENDHSKFEENIASFKSKIASMV